MWSNHEVMLIALGIALGIAALLFGRWIERKIDALLSSSFHVTVDDDDER